jgi:hypothetical protein
MRTTDIVELRLRNQKLSKTALRKPEDVVAWLGAVQSQDYAGAKWGVAQRAVGLTDAAIDRAFDDGRILRTHILRPTWHFVPADDLRWMLSLSSPRVQAATSYYSRRLGVTPPVVTRAHKAFERALRNAQSLTRTELAAALKRSGIDAAGQRLAGIVMNAELEQVLTSGPRRGKQFTYMLVDDRVRRARRLDADAALTELARRYFTSHGPATLRDFSWWSGLTMGQGRAALEQLGKEVEREIIDGLTYWIVPSRSTGRSTASSVYLLPNYDEYLIAYRDRGNAQPLMTTANANRSFDIYAHILVVDGRFGGTWRRAAGREGHGITVTPFSALARRHTRDLHAAADRLSTFLGSKVAVAAGGRTPSRAIGRIQAG